ncbi:hypothetical protein WA026_014769 [Henosepilachna vigintioctopunctata]|uniref:Uncharacterized protein n=1 Tax=Henosepilachna vigintioctopunctata TaxID=420089 RepID=A0AAW1UT41_9CUCU
MISRILSDDSTRTYCPVSEQKLLEMRKDNHIFLKYIHSKILQHIRMEKFLEPAEVLMYIQKVKNMNTDQSNIESFRKKIRNMLLTINDSLVQFEQAVCSGEVPLYSIDIGQNGDFSQQSSGTSVAEVPSFSSIELTNRDFMTIHNNSQNSINLDYCNTNFKKIKENSVDQLYGGKFKHYERTGAIKKLSNKKYFKKPIKKNKIKIHRSKIDEDVLNNNGNLHFSVYCNKNDTGSIRNKMNDSEIYISNSTQDIFSSNLERLNFDTSKDVIVNETSINGENQLSQDINSNITNDDRGTKKNIENELNFQDLHSQNESNYVPNSVRKKICDVEQLNTILESCSAKEDEMITSNENRGYNSNLISNNVIPETEISCTNTKNVQFLHNQSGSKEKKNSIGKVNNPDILISNQIVDQLNCKTIENKQFINNSQLTPSIAHSFCSVISDSAFSATKNFISQAPDGSCSQGVIDNYTYFLEYRKYNNMFGSFILYKNLLPFHDYKYSINSSLNLKCNEHIDEQPVAASNNIIAIGGEVISEPQENSSYSRPYVRKLMNKNSDREIQYGNIKKLHGKMALEAEKCFNTWDKFINALAEVENNMSSKKFQKKAFPSNGYEYQYDTMQKICDEYVNRFSYHRSTHKAGDEYISIEKKIKKWSEFQDLIIKIKEARKRKHIDVK